MKNSPIQLESVKPDLDRHTNGREECYRVAEAIRAEFGSEGAHVVVGDTSWHDYFTVSVARIAPSRTDGARVLAAVRRPLPAWHRVTVSVHFDRNEVMVIACAHNRMSSDGSCLPQHRVVTAEEMAGAKEVAK